LSDRGGGEATPGIVEHVGGEEAERVTDEYLVNTCMAKEKS